MPVVYVALVDAHPTETDARQALTVWTGTYHGIWHHPTPERPLVHVFSDATEQQIADAGWTRPEPVEHDASTFGDMARGVRVYLRNDGTRREEPWEGA
jgi:hypothetical protein